MSARDVMQSEQFMNLQVHRSDADAWERGGWRGRYLHDRLGASLAFVGAGLFFFGAFSPSRRSRSSVWLQVTGASLLSCAAARLANQYSPKIVRSGHDSAAADVVTLESVDSFPASDAPSSNATTASPQPLPHGTGREG
jgi:hypothetical protein